MSTYARANPESAEITVDDYDELVEQEAAGR